MERLNTIFRNRRGTVRLCWLLALAAVLYGMAQVGVTIAYWLGYQGLMNAWGVTDRNILRAPAAVQWLYQYAGVLLILIQCAPMLGAVRVLNALSGQRVQRSARGLGQGMLLGAAGVTAIWGLLLLLGSVRLGWRLTKPAFSVNTVALLVTVSAQSLAEGAFFWGAVWPLAGERMNRWLAVLLMALLGASVALLSGVTQPLALLNMGLLMMLGALLTHDGRIAPAVGLLFMWRYMDRGVLGFAGSTAALYESYPVNRYWLCGGNAGLNAGLMATLLLGAMLLMLVHRQGWFKRK